MDTRRLAFLRELAERGTVGAVADAMKVTPSAVSQQLKALEREAGYTLVEPPGAASSSPPPAVRWPRRRPRSRWPSSAPRVGGASTWSSRPGASRCATFPTGGEMLLPGLLTRMADVPDVELVCTDENNARSTSPT